MGKLSRIFNFDNIGGKIKNLAKWSCWIEILLTWISAPITMIVLLCDRYTAEFFWIPLVSALIGPIFIWIGSWAMYAFGEAVEDIHALRSKQNPQLENIDRNVQLMAAPLILEAEEQAKREAVERAKYEATKKATREAEEKAKREAEVKAKREAAAVIPELPKKEKTLPEKLEYALRYSTDSGMISYLKDIENEDVQIILQSPAHLVRGQIQSLLETLQ